MPARDAPLSPATDLIVFFEQDLSRLHLAAFSLGHRHHAMQRERHREDLVGHLHLAGFDLLGDRDLFLARQERHAAHLLQIHPHRIRGVPEGALFGLRRLDFGLGGLRFGLRFGDEGLFLHGLDDLDVHVAEHRHHAVELFA
jgi:hypothetical protein